MTVYPAIDLKGGRCVRLAQGRADQETAYSDDPLEVAEGFRAAGAQWIHLVDLDGAFTGEMRNLEAVGRIAALGVAVQFGGGLRTPEAVAEVLGRGVRRAVIGTRAAESDAFVAELVREHGERIAVGIDAKDGKVAVRGWVGTTGADALALARRMEAAGVRTLIHTDVATDGMLSGPNLEAQEAMLGAVSCRVIASGGVGRREDVAALAALAGRHPGLEGVIVGRALYERRVDLRDLIRLASSSRG